MKQKYLRTLMLSGILVGMLFTLLFEKDDKKFQSNDLTQETELPKIYEK